MEPDAKIITIGTFFTEENRYEQRPYRFRTPYTATQGAKNRLVEALAWELVDKGVRSLATNPGPVHSDRIYKTVYPKAVPEFLRIGGYSGLSSVEIERATTTKHYHYWVKRILRSKMAFVRLQRNWPNYEKMNLLMKLKNSSVQFQICLLRSKKSQRRYRTIQVK